MTSKITTDIAVDPALPAPDLASFTPAQRQYIDDQIRGCQQHMVQSLLRATVGTWLDLDPASAQISPGDLLQPGPSANTVTRLVDATQCVAIAMIAAAPGSRLRAAYVGRIGPEIIGPLDPGVAVADASSGRVIVPMTLGNGDRIIGFVDAHGALWLDPPSKATGGGGETWTTYLETITTGNQVEYHRYYDLPTQGDGLYIYECVGLYVAPDGTYSHLNAELRFWLKSATFTRLIGDASLEPTLKDNPTTQTSRMDVVTTTTHHAGFIQADFSFISWRWGAGSTLLTGYRLKCFVPAPPAS